MGQPVRRIQWVPEHGGAVPYLVALAAWLPATVGTLIAASEGPPWLAVLVGAVALAAHYVPHDMCLSASITEKRSPVGAWVLRAQLWLLFGGAVPQAVRILRQER